MPRGLIPRASQDRRQPRVIVLINSRENFENVSTITTTGRSGNSSMARLNAAISTGSVRFNGPLQHKDAQAL